jgi:hypothetical protein
VLVQHQEDERRPRPLKDDQLLGFPRHSLRHGRE